MSGIRLLESVYGPRRRLRYHEHNAHKVTKSQEEGTVPGSAAHRRQVLAISWPDVPQAALRESQVPIMEAVM